MADGSHIEWTDATWNPVTGCSVVSAGCTNCYAMRLAGTRLAHHPSRAGLTTDSKAGPVWNGRVRLNEQWLDQPLRWRRPRRIFVCAHGDLFHPAVREEWIDRVFAVMALSPQHTFQVLTKRPERMPDYFNARREGDPWAEAADDIADLAGIREHPVVLEPREIPLSHVWLGTSCENQAAADARIPHLLATPAAVRFVSLEPLLGPIDLTRWMPHRWHCSGCGERTDEPVGRCNGYCQDASGASCDAVPCPSCGRVHYWTGSMSSLDWVIVGGESGPGARPMHPDWVRPIRDQCQAAGVPFFFKQWGEWIEMREAGALTFMNTVRWDAPQLYGKLSIGGEDLFEGRSFRTIYSVNGTYVLLGKKRAGRLLDGRTHDGMPGT